MGLWDLLVLAAVIASALLLFMRKFAALPALIASGVAMLRGFEVVDIELEAIPLPTLLAAVIAVTGGVVYFANSEKHPAAAGAVLLAIGGVMLVFLLELF